MSGATLLHRRLDASRVIVARRIIDEPPHRVADHPHALSLLAGPVPVDVHVPLPLDADHFPTHLAADPLGTLDHPLADGHLLLDHRPLLHGDLLLADRDADLLDGLARRGLPLDDHLLPLHRDLQRPVLGDDLLADPDRARLHALLVGLQLLLADLDPRALGSPGRLVLRAKRLAVPQPPLLHGLDRLGPPAADSGRHRHEPRVDPWAEHLLLNLYRELSGLAIRRKDLVGHVTSLLHAYPVRRKLGSHHLSTWIGCGGAVAASRGRPRSRMTTARGGRARRGEGIRAPLSRRASRAEDRSGAEPEARPAQVRAVRGPGPITSGSLHFWSGSPPRTSTSPARSTRTSSLRTSPPTCSVPWTTRLPTVTSSLTTGRFSTLTCSFRTGMRISSPGLMSDAAGSPVGACRSMTTSSRCTGTSIVRCSVTTSLRTRTSPVSTGCLWACSSSSRSWIRSAPSAVREAWAVVRMS